MAGIKVPWGPFPCLDKPVHLNRRAAQVICRQPAHDPVDPQRNPLTASLVILRDRRACAAGRLLVDGPHVHRRAAANHRFEPVAIGVDSGLAGLFRGAT